MLVELVARLGYLGHDVPLSSIAHIALCPGFPLRRWVLIILGVKKQWSNNKVHVGGLRSPVL